VPTRQAGKFSKTDRERLQLLPWKQHCSSRPGYWPELHRAIRQPFLGVCSAGVIAGQGIHSSRMLRMYPHAHAKASCMLFDVGQYRRDMGVAFTALGGPRLVRYLGLNLMNSLLGEGVVAVNLLSHHW
jgi:hypothetical protein